MCRFALYLGPELPISSLITEPVNSIIHQSYDSLERSEPLNGDGFGLAWYVPGIAEPALFRDLTPAWSNANLQHLARVTRTTCLLAHVRAATPGLPVQQTNCHPFTWGSLAFMHNGLVAGFARLRRRLIERLSDEAFALIRGSTDSEHLFALFVDHFRALERAEDAPADRSARLTQALRATIASIEALCADEAEASQLNLVVCDGRHAAVSRYSSDGGARTNTLYLLRGDTFVCSTRGDCWMTPPQEEGRAVLVASEPLTSRRDWDAVPVNHLVELHPERPPQIASIGPGRA